MYATYASSRCSWFDALIRLFAQASRGTPYDTNRLTNLVTLLKLCSRGSNSASIKAAICTPALLKTFSKLLPIVFNLAHSAYDLALSQVAGFIANICQDSSVGQGLAPSAMPHPNIHLPRWQPSLPHPPSPPPPPCCAACRVAISLAKEKPRTLVSSRLVPSPAALALRLTQPPAPPPSTRPCRAAAPHRFASPAPAPAHSSTNTFSPLRCATLRVFFRARARSIPVIALRGRCLLQADVCCVHASSCIALSTTGWSSSIG